MKLADAPEVVRLGEKLKTLDAQKASLDALSGQGPARLFIDVGVAEKGNASFEIDAGFADNAINAVIPFIAAERKRTVDALTVLGVDLNGAA